jgi:HAD superfamily hydrolase (TIGR01509 family)
MNIIIPVGGKGERFKHKGYTVSKPLIEVFEKEMILHVLDNLILDKDDRIFIIYCIANLNECKFETIVNKSKHKPIHFIKIDKQTTGASETIMYGLNKITSITTNTKCILLDCDTFYTEDVLSLYRSIDGNAVFYTLNHESIPIYSYIRLDSYNNILDIKEKNKISDNANTGIYCFNDINELHHYSRLVVANGTNFNGECYTSCIIDTMIKDGKSFRGIQLNPDCVFNLGTPEQLDAYVNHAQLFLFDLDGTLVITDDIYFDAWEKILKQYNLQLTHDMFKTYIAGHSDSSVARHLLSDNSDSLTSQLSIMKDELFLQNIHKIKIITGAVDFLHKIKSLGHKIAIVTNCNRIVAEEILKHCNIFHLVDTVVVGNECNRSKPHADPYINAITFFNSTNKKAIIFEDSKTGIQSGKNTFPKCLIGIETTYSSTELLNYGSDLTINDYADFNLNLIYDHVNINMETIKKQIKQSFPKLKITHIEILNQKLKGGFIADVIGLKIHTEDKCMDCVLKLENKNDTVLSKMANDIGLYDREYYFYNDLSQYVPISIPEFYGLVRDENLANIGILMNNLASLNYKLNIDLNTEKIDTTLIIVDRLAQMHSRFWNKDLHTNFKKLKKHNDPMFNPKWDMFIKSKWDNFKLKWKNILTEPQMTQAQTIVDNFQTTQNELSDKNLTLCHGDVKSANIFYKPIDAGNNVSYEPYFIDWQYNAIGKGVQDLVFFMIESFEIEKMNIYKNIIKNYYYAKLREYDVQNYTVTDYEKDFTNATHYFPFFVAIWFGTLNDDELIDKNFPFFFIKKYFNFISP